MLFNSMQFAIFLPIVFMIYWVLPHRFRWIVLFIASYWFYMGWNPKYVVLILGTTVISYSAAIILDKLTCIKLKKLTLTITAILCLGVLFFFKYFNFLSESVTDLLNLFTIQVNPITLNLILPVGISFYTFQTLSYVIDVYRGDIAAEYHFGKYATFISFFPQLVAGPIERANNLLPQIKAKHKFNYSQATYGMKLMAWGFFKKMVIADTIAPFTGRVFESPQQFQGFSLIIAACLFSFQIYCDFSGYSDIAIGVSKLMGIELMTNFKSPYFAQSIREFWSRWHISLSTWIRDYIYIPLGGNRVSKMRNAFNLIVTFLASGLWHGANWTYVIWGGIHGVAQALESNLIPRKYRKSSGIIWGLRVILIFAFCTFTWIFFASNSLSDAMYILSHLFDGIFSPIMYLRNGVLGIGIEKGQLITIIFSLILLMGYDYVSLKNDCIKIISEKNVVIRNLVYLFLLCIIIFLKATEAAEFVYFQF